ncbi:MAG: hypothetical protein IJ154_00170 [Bacteroidales bacterium]|nr:hypothetical protein [Bacteroidales bacterium]
MKKLTVLLMFAALAGTIMAQDAPVLSDALKAKNAGNEAYNNKDYVSAINHYEVYLKSGEEGIEDDIYTQNLYEMSFYYAGNAFLREKNYAKAYEYFQKFQALGRPDTPTDCRFLYNFANTAKQLDKDDEAMELYHKCIAINCNKDASTYAIAQIYRQAGTMDSMTVYLERAFETIPQAENKYYSRMLQMWQIQELKEATDVMKSAQEWSQKAAGADVNTYLANMGKAADLYKQAIPMYEKVLKYEGVDDKTIANVGKAKSSIEVCKQSINSFESYKKTIKR